MAKDCLEQTKLLDSLLRDVFYLWLAGFETKLEYVSDLVVSPSLSVRDIGLPDNGSAGKPLGEHRVVAC